MKLPATEVQGLNFFRLLNGRVIKIIEEFYIEKFDNGINVKKKEFYILIECVTLPPSISITLIVKQHLNFKKINNGF